MRIYYYERYTPHSRGDQTNEIIIVFAETIEESQKILEEKVRADNLYRGFENNLDWYCLVLDEPIGTRNHITITSAYDGDSDYLNWDI